MTNIVLIVGNVGQDPVARSTQGGSTITSLSVATSRKYRNTAEELVEETEWHRVTCFNGLGKNVATYVRKGMKVAVEGRLHYTKWTDNAGVERYGVEIYADKVDFLTKAPEAVAPAEPAPAKGRGKKQPAPAGDIDDDIPF
jgi:single-strand DNA-binding protein